MNLIFDKNEYSNEVKDLSFGALKDIVTQVVDAPEGKRLAAKWEMQNRNCFEPEWEQYFQNSTEKNDDVEFVESESVDEEYTGVSPDLQDWVGYPPKPKLQQKEQTFHKSLLSMVGFIALFYLLFDWEIQAILVLVGVILIHEMGHFIAMRIFNYKDLSIFFVPLLGAYASGTKDNISQKQKVIISLAGPLPGVIIGTVLLMWGLNSGNEKVMDTAGIFLFLNLFNLLPIMPLDGGKVVKDMFFEKNEIINTVFMVISIAILVYIAIVWQSFILLIVPFFLVIQLNSRHQLKKVKVAVAEKGIDVDKSYDELSDKEYWLIRDELGTHMKTYRQHISPKNYTTSLAEPRIVKTVQEIAQKRPIKDLSVLSKVFVSILWAAAFIAPVIVMFLHQLKMAIGG